MEDWTDQLAAPFILRNTRYVVDADAGCIEAVILGTDGDERLVLLDNETATLELLLTEKGSGLPLGDGASQRVLEASNYEPWALLMGRKLKFRWRLQNDMRYFDGLCLSDANADIPRVLLLATLGIDIHVLTRVTSRQWTPSSPETKA
jgi:hypothetical protein